MAAWLAAVTYSAFTGADLTGSSACDDGVAILMARTRTTKTVAQRIDLNYFKRATPFKRAKLWLAIVAPAIALVWIAWHFLGHDNRVYSSGRLSGAHAVLENECGACHVRQSGGFSATAADSGC